MTASRSAVRRLSVARFASSGGTHAGQYALAFTIYEQTHSPMWVSTWLVASAGVVGLVGPLSGRLSDRFNQHLRHGRRPSLLEPSAGSWSSSPTDPSRWCSLPWLATAANTPFKAAAGTESVPNLVAADDLSWANGTIATATNASLLVGPLVGGAIISAAGPASRLRPQRHQLPGVGAGDRPSARHLGRHGWTTGEPGSGGRWRTVGADRQRRRLLAVTALAFAAFGVTLVADLPLVDHLGGDVTGYALLTTLWGAGAIVGSSVAARIPARHELTALTVGVSRNGDIAGVDRGLCPNLPLAIAVGGHRRRRERHRVHAVVLAPAAHDT